MSDKPDFDPKDPKSWKNVSFGGKGKWLIIAALLAGSAYECVYNNSATEYMVIQSRLNGSLTWYKTPGPAFTLFGSVTKYKKLDTFEFLQRKDKPDTAGDEGISMRFNDQAHAWAYGSIAWEMPGDDEHLNLLHSKFGSQKGVDAGLIRPVIEKSIKFSGPLMSSTESASGRRNELLRYIEDTMETGVYQTKTTQQQVLDPITQTHKTVDVTEVVKDADGKPVVAVASPFVPYRITISNISIREVRYDDVVDAQIKQQQEANGKMQVQAALAKTAEQEAITNEQQGKAKAATAKWNQEVLKTTAVTLAQQQQEVALIEAEQQKKVQLIEAARLKEVALITAEREKAVKLTNALRDKEAALTLANQELEVATLGIKTADAKKLAVILEGEGEAKKRSLIFAADGALAVKADILKSIAASNAQGLAQFKGNITPGIVFGAGTTGTGTGTGGDNAFNNWLQTQTALAAQRLQLDLTLPATPAVPAPAK